MRSNSHAIPRRGFLKQFGAAAAGFTLGAAAVRRASAAERKRPNILFILADDLGYGDVGCYGQEKIKTPRLDRMAAEGMKFTDSYAGSTVCAPSRCVLMTGLHTGHCLIRGNARVPLRPHDVTVAELLKQAGYVTALIGKWGLGEAGSTGIPTRQGFDTFFGYLNQHHAHNYYPAFLWLGEKRTNLKNVVPGKGEFGTGVATKKVEYSHDLLAAEALKFVEQNKDRPFFLYLALTIPHANNEAGRKGMEVPDYGIYADLDWPEPQKGHAAMITLMDRDIGRLLDKLKALGIDGRTLVIFSSDNGPHREGGANPAFSRSSGPLTGTKRSLTEGGIRVPQIARWPGKVKPGSVTDHATSFEDFLPTACELAGAAPPGGIDGVSYAATLLGKPQEQKKRDFFYWEFHEGRASQQAVRMGKWKAIRSPFDGPLRLYDLEADIAEKHNVADKHPQIVKKIEEYLKTARSESARWPMRKARPGRPRKGGKPSS